MPNPFETALDEHRKLIKQVARLEQELNTSLEREAILKGRIEQLDKQLASSQEEAKYNLHWACEVTTQMNNVGLFVHDAIQSTRQRVTKGNSGVVEATLDAVRKAIAHEPVQSEHEERRIHDHQADR